MTPVDLVTRWREQAAAYEGDGQPGAVLLRRVAAELDEALQGTEAQRGTRHPGVETNPAGLAVLAETPPCRCGRRADLARIRDARGRDHGLWWCRDCERRVGADVVPRGRLGSDFYLLPLVHEHHPAPLETCIVCGQVTFLVDHHIAPRAVFGDEADRWPTIHVCRACHERWHEVMGIA